MIASDIEKQALRYYLHNCYRRIDQDLLSQILRDLDFNTRIKRNGGRLRDRAAQSWRLMSLKLTRCEAKPLNSLYPFMLRGVIDTSLFFSLTL